MPNNSYGPPQTPMTASKAVTAFCATVLTGAGMVVSSGLVHGTALIWTEVGIGAFSVLVNSLGVYATRNTPIFPPGFDTAPVDPPKTAQPVKVQASDPGTVAAPATRTGA